MRIQGRRGQMEIHCSRSDRCRGLVGDPSPSLLPLSKRLQGQPTTRRALMGVGGKWRGGGDALLFTSVRRRVRGKVSPISKSCCSRRRGASVSGASSLAIGLRAAQAVLSAYSAARSGIELGGALLLSQQGQIEEGSGWCLRSRSEPGRQARSVWSRRSFFHHRRQARHQTRRFVRQWRRLLWTLRRGAGSSLPRRGGRRGWRRRRGG